MTNHDGHARNEDPETSHDAAEMTARRLAIKVNLMRYYIEAARRGEGLTDEEAMQMAGYDMADDGHRRRCSDLRDNKAGRVPWIVQQTIDGVPVKRKSERTGKDRMVCIPTNEGLDAMGIPR